MFKSLPAKLACLTSCLMLLAITASQTSAQRPQRDMQKEAGFWEELAAISPGSVEAFKQGTEAMDSGDMQRATMLYKQVMEKAPKWDVINRRLGYTLVETGAVAEGMALLRKALELKRSPDNLLGLATKLAYPGEKTQGSSTDKTQALALVKEALAKNTDQRDSSYLAMLAQLSLDLRNEQDFRAATGELVKSYPDMIYTHYFNAIRAAMDEEWSTAEQEMRTAGRMGVPAETVNAFLDSGIHTRVVAWRYTYIALGVVLAWALGLALLFLIGGMLSKRTLKNLETADPQTLVSAEHEKMRRIYRKVINIAGLYYYLSIPVVIFLIIVVSGAVIYGFLIIGTIPVKLVLFLALGALITIYQIIRSLFVRYEAEDPGRILQQDEAPGLWALSQEVARTIGTRPVSEIRVTPGTDVAVYERGSFRERMNDRAERVLIVGVGVLNGFSQNAFRAVLAHEYGHFSHRDTAGGDMALRVKSDMLKFARAMVLSRQNTYWNLGFHFLRLYHRIFTRISHGAGRFQEVLADRLASYHFGARSFEEGLRHVVLRQIEFEHLAKKEISEAVNARRALTNLYELTKSEELDQQKTLEEEFQKAIHRETSDTDTHPSPSERFRLASLVTSKEETFAAGNVWDLFLNREALTQQMSSEVEARLRGA
jgi:tetratricopeptide (TPR) repeat protein